VVAQLFSLGGLARMKNISTSRIAIWSGVFAEIIACVSFVLCLGYGSSAPSHASSIYISFIAMFHMPGLWLGALLAHVVGIFILLPFAILIGMVSFAAIFWVSITLWRRFHEKHTS
jgi:hypothetical protein